MPVQGSQPALRRDWAEKVLNLTAPLSSLPVEGVPGESFPRA